MSTKSTHLIVIIDQVAHNKGPMGAMTRFQTGRMIDIGIVAIYLGFKDNHT